MLVKDWMTPRPVVVAPTTSLMEARRLLRRHGFRHLPVVDAEGALVGIASSHDLQIHDDLLVDNLHALASDLLTGRYRSVDTVMTPQVVTTSPSSPVERAARLMLARRVSALPVVEHRRLVGILSLADCVLALLDRAERSAASDPREVAR